MWTWLMNFFRLRNKEENVFVNQIESTNVETKAVEPAVEEIVEVETKTAEDEILPIISNSVDLTAMKKDELLAMAKEKGLKANASMNKQALIDLING